ncbi:MAG: hypothetical protein K0V04_17600 [Deltaproteobacteria bacterium]|nr:hypothetical protein [Deltaproteobacteria bacterium]
MSFVNIKHWPTLAPGRFRTQYERLGMSEAPGLWFRALGAVRPEAGGGTLVIELWSDHLHWREQHEAERSRASVKQAKAQHGVARPGHSVRHETTSHYLREADEDGRGRWLSLDGRGGVLVAAYPGISVSKYESGLDKHGLHGDAPGGRGVLCAADGPYDEGAWLLMRCWADREDEREAVARQLGDLRKPDKASLLLESRLDHAYFVPGCPAGSENPFGAGRFL